MAKRQLPSQEDLRQLLRYEAETGKLFWRSRTVDMFNDGKQSAAHRCNAWNAKFEGKEAFTAETGHGYLSGAIWNTTHPAHRIVWALACGVCDGIEIDHINGDRTDNRISNLRLATSSENKHNQGLRKSNRSGFKGVSWNKPCGKWMAAIRRSRKMYYLGLFDSATEAAAAYDAAAREFHGAFARLNCR